MLCINGVSIHFMPNNISENDMYDDIDDNLHPDEDYSYTWPVGNEEVVVQWELMAEHGIITHETAARLSAADAEYVKAVLARCRPSRMSEVNRLKFMRT